ncbi:MAG: wax ester/triacylglycerol synthase family O-acyltransferase [Saprospiraceae bacterium]|nr:wax ester/triacylglycerol synthase family O-acyltransferase [Saprospiraceae bacterium]
MINKLISQLNLPNVKSISGMDATFLYAETPTSPMHVGSVAILEGSLKYKDFRKLIMSRIHLIPKFRRRLMYVPFSVDHPYWVDDPDFNIDMHIKHVALPKPGDWKHLRRMASREFSEPLDQSRPLWSFTFVEGLDNLSQVKKGSVAIISKVHHVAIDGMAGAGLLAVLFDFGPKAGEIPPPKPYKPKPVPNEISLMLKSGLGFAKDPLKFPRIMKESLEATVRAGFVTRAQHLDLPTAPFTAPKTPLNGIISAERKWNTSIISLSRVKRLKNIMGTTVNDILLAICSGAIRRYLKEKKKLPKKPLVAMVPISTREKEGGIDGNQLSAMLVQLATHIEDPIERLEKIYENTIKGKTYQGATGAKTLSNLAESVPFGVANQAARLYSRFHLSKMHNPVFNVVITNVPGPQIPIYMHGHKLLHIMGMAPIIDGMGLIITILSYGDEITISPTTDKYSMPDSTAFSNYILDAANELEKHVLEYDTSKVKKTKEKVKRSTTKTNTYFTKVRRNIKANPKAFEGLNGKVQFLIKGPEPVDYLLNLDAKVPTIRKHRAKTFDVSFTIQDVHLKKIETGELDYESALVQGRLVLTGNEALAKRILDILHSIS